jgi:hypothetical protein
MHLSLSGVLLLLALICFFLSAVNVPVKWINLYGLGMFFVTLAWMVSAYPHL